jgi:hypothetical protein
MDAGKSNTKVFTVVDKAFIEALLGQGPNADMLPHRERTAQ